MQEIIKWGEERRELAPPRQEVHGEFGAAIETDDLVQIAMKNEGEQVPERSERVGPGYQTKGERRVSAKGDSSPRSSVARRRTRIAF